MAGVGAGILSRLDASLEFTQQLLDTQPTFAAANPLVKDRFAKLKEQNRNYLAHEYMTHDWHPMYFADLARWLEPAKLTFACSANLLDHVDALNILPAQQKLLAGIPDPQFRQTVRDFVVNQQFRKDYWVKGARRLSPLRQAELLRGHRVVLVTPRADVPLKVQAAAGQGTLSEGVYAPILDVLSDHGIRTLGEMETVVAGKGISFAQLVQAVVVLAGMGHVMTAQDEPAIGAARKTTRPVNQALMQLARSPNDISHLASPVTGGGIAVARFAQLFALALQNGRKQPADWAAFVWQLLAAQGQSILKEGKALEGADANLAELNQQARAFADKQLPLLRALQVI